VFHSASSALLAGCVAAVGLLASACGGDHGDVSSTTAGIFSPVLPSEDVRLVEGESGWLLGVPQAPVPSGAEARLWLNNSRAVRGDRFTVNVVVDSPPGGRAGFFNYSAAAPGWSYVSYRRADVAGSYLAKVVDPESGATLVEAEFLVAAE